MKNADGARSGRIGLPADDEHVAQRATPVGGYDREAQLAQPVLQALRADELEPFTPIDAQSATVSLEPSGQECTQASSLVRLANEDVPTRRERLSRELEHGGVVLPGQVVQDIEQEHDVALRERTSSHVAGFERGVEASAR